MISRWNWVSYYWFYFVSFRFYFCWIIYGITFIRKLKSIGLNPSLKKHGQTYTLELGLFKNKAGSKRLSNKLENNGLEPVTSKITIRNAHYIVRINGFLSKREARKSHQQLINQGFKNSFIRPS